MMHLEGLELGFNARNRLNYVIKKLINVNILKIILFLKQFLVLCVEIVSLIYPGYKISY